MLGGGIEDRKNSRGPIRDLTQVTTPGAQISVFNC